MRKFKETKKQFDKVREDLELSLVRNAQAPRHRPHEVEEATGALTLTRKCFRHLALDYVLQVSCWAWRGGGCSRTDGAVVWRGASGSVKPKSDLGKGRGGWQPERPRGGDGLGQAGGLGVGVRILDFAHGGDPTS